MSDNRKGVWIEDILSRKYWAGGLVGDIHTKQLSCGMKLVAFLCEIEEGSFRPEPIGIMMVEVVGVGVKEENADWFLKAAENFANDVLSHSPIGGLYLGGTLVFGGKDPRLGILRFLVMNPNL